MQRILFLILFISLFIFGMIVSQRSNSRSNLPKILISQTIEHPALDSTVQGILDELSDQNFKSGETLTIRIESAQANASLAAQIASKFVAQKPDLVVGVGTLSAQSFLKYVHTNMTKLVFSSITDPVSAQLISPNTASTGVSNFVDLEPQIELFIKLQPQLKNLGIIYQTGELNSIHLIPKLEKICQKFNLKLITQGVTKTGEISQAATKLALETDAIFISNDNTALSSLPSIIQAAMLAKIPVYASDTDAVKLGALAALGPNQYQIGRQTGQMIAKILNHANILDIPIEYPKETQLFLNLKTAQLLNIQIPESILKSAHTIIQ